MPALSIIIPVYNAERYLRRCLESILSQEYDNYEVILIDDKSVDDSLIICEEYVRKDSRIKLIPQEHKGVGAARNAGLKAAKGKYTLFIDADDQLTPETLQDDIDLYNEDLVLALFNYDLLSGKCIPYPHLKCDHSDLKDFIYDNLPSTFMGVVWGKFFLTTKALDIKFDEEMRLGEDMLFVTKYLNIVQSYKVIDRPIYIYTNPENFVKKYHHSIIEATNCLTKIFSAYRNLDIHCQKFEVRIFIVYKELCQNEIYYNVDLWFKNETVIRIYNGIKEYFGIRYRIAYKIMSYPLPSKLIAYKKHIKAAKQ